MRKNLFAFFLFAGVSFAASTLADKVYPSVQDLVNRKVATQPRVTLAPKTSDADLNFVRAYAQAPAAGQAMKAWFEAIVYKGAIEPEVKLGMALRIAQYYDSQYLAVQAERRLRTTPRGQEILKSLGTRPISNPTTADAIALSFTEKLTANATGISEQDWQPVRMKYNDGQMVELVMTTCYFNYLLRVAEAFRLPAEDWAFEKQAPASKVELPIAKVTLISDEEMLGVDVIRKRAEETRAQAPAAGLGVEIANSMRAMYLNPAAAYAFQSYGTTLGQFYSAVDRTMKLHISFAVSMANGCRYCTLHQVLGLRRMGVDIAKLQSMQKDDSSLTPKELVVVQFARKLTANPKSITDADYDKVKANFGEQGAMEVVFQTSMFAHMNRFTDTLRLPSEDVAVAVYKETYGHNYDGSK